MSASVFGSSEAMLDEDSKPNKQNSRAYGLQGAAQQQVGLSHQLPSIFTGRTGGQLPLVKPEENSQTANYFNNPYPVYFQAQSRREVESTCQYYGNTSAASNASAQANSNYYPTAMSPQASFSGGYSLTVPVAVKPVKKAKPTRVDKCVCKRVENHIPRPRNAFILFRQKHHQSVLKEKTNLKTNPEVSRELARRWKALSVEERDHWNGLAEEEKKNHAKKYPNYRYKPRRSKNASQCPVCQVKTIEKPPTPQHNFALFPDYPQFGMAQDSKLARLPLMQLGLQNHLQLQVLQHPHQSQNQNLNQNMSMNLNMNMNMNLNLNLNLNLNACQNQYQQQYHQTQQLQTQQMQNMQQAESSYLAQRYFQYGGYQSQGQYSFGDGMSGMSNGGHLQQPQHNLLLPLSQYQQQYMLQLQQRNQQQYPQQQQQQQLQQQQQQQQPQPQPQPQQQQQQQLSYASLQPLLHSSSVQSSQGVASSQFPGYAEKYHDTPSNYQSSEQSPNHAVYKGLPTPMTNTLYSGHESYSVQPLLQLY